MHTRFDFILHSNKPQGELQLLCDRLQTTVKEFERIGNKFDAASEISLLNSGAKEDRSEALERLLAEALQYKELTGGLFNPLYSGTWDLSGFLKGYTLDRLHDILKEEGIEDALLNAGNSSILALGSNEGRPWEVEVDGFEMSDNAYFRKSDCEKPHKALISLYCKYDTAGKQSDEKILRRENEAVALTISGNDSSERRHIVNPCSGKLVGGHRAVAVVTSSAAAGEALATALFIEPDEEKYRKSGLLHEFYSLEKPKSR